MYFCSGLFRFFGGNCHKHSVEVQIWVRDRNRYLVDIPECHLFDNAGELAYFVDFFAGHITVQMLEEAHEMFAEQKAELSRLKFRSSSCRRATSLVDDRITTKKCANEAIRIVFQSKDFEPGRWFFLGPVDEDQWYGRLINRLKV